MIGCFAGEQILNGSTQFCLTTQSLSQLNHAFRRYSETKYDFEAKREGERSRHGSGRGRSRLTQEQEQFQRWRTNAQFLNDFITKTASLKVIYGCMLGLRIRINYRHIRTCYHNT